MSFLAPLFFVALAALAVPVLIHLIQREKKQVVRFPSLMFVQRIPYKSVRRRRIHNWVLLMVRLAALTLIVLAFARPFLERPDLAAAGGGAREVVVLFDQSYSMGYGDRWDRARAAANDAIEALGPVDRGSVVLFSSGAEIALRSAGSTNRRQLSAAVADATLTDGATRYSPALKVAGGILADSPLPRREVILISDFQRGGWRGEEGTRLPQGTTLTPVAIAGGADAPNVTVTTVSLGRSTFENQERVTVTAGVVNRGTQSLTAGQISLEIGGRPVQTERLDVEANGSASVAFAPVTLAGGNMRGTVRAGTDALAADNAFNFIVSPAQPVPVFVVDRGGSSAALYLTRALAIGDSPRFDTTVRRPGALSDDDLRRAAVVVLNDVPVSPALGRRLARFVDAGGGLLVALGGRATWPQAVDVLPALAEAPIDRTREAARLGAIEYGHEVFEPFRAPRSGDFAAVHIYGYRAVAPGAGAQVLARFDGGAPALLERRVGTGRVLLWTSTLDLAWGDFPLKPVFLPFVHQAMRHLAAYAEPAPWLTVGQVLDASAGPPASPPVAGVVLTPSGRRVPLGDEGSEVMELTEQGFYEVRGQSGDTVLSVVASNVDPAEADLTPMDPRELVAATAGDGGGTAGAGDGTPLTPEAQERAQRLWWYLLVAGIVLLGADTLISNRLSKT